MTEFVPPFAQAPTAAPTAATAPQTATPAAVDPVANVDSVEKKRKKSGEARATPNRQMTKDDVIFVINNVKTMSYSEIAAARGLTKHQVNRALMEAKKMLREAAGEDADKKAKAETYIKEHLSRPEDTLPGSGGGRKSEVKKAINDVVGDILNSL